MKLKIINGCVEIGDKIYYPTEVITIKDKERVKRLMEEGFCIKIDAEAEDLESGIELITDQNKTVRGAKTKKGELNLEGINV